MLQNQMTIIKTTHKDGFEYTLWKDGKKIESYRSPYLYPLGIVTVIGSKITLEFKAVKNIHFNDVMDDNIYLVNVTNPIPVTTI